MQKEAAPYEADEPVYTVLDPRSREPEVEYRGLNPRLDTLAGKNIIVANLHGGNEEIMESIAADLKGAVAACEVVYYPTKGRWADLVQELIQDNGLTNHLAKKLALRKQQTKKLSFYRRTYEIKQPIHLKDAQGGFEPESGADRGNRCGYDQTDHRRHRD